jgi:hypothetical protein
MAFIEVVLSFLPMLLTLLAWRFERSAQPPLLRTRARVFKGGLLFSIVTSLLIAGCWFNPFPLQSDGHGGYSDARNYQLQASALSAAVVTTALGSFGRGTPRLLMICNGVALFALAFSALLSNDV